MKYFIQIGPVPTPMLSVTCQECSLQGWDPFSIIYTGAIAVGKIDLKKYLAYSIVLVAQGEPQERPALPDLSSLGITIEESSKKAGS